jgi:hypothetical protein
MSAFAGIVSILLAVSMVASSVGMLTRQEPVVDSLSTAGVPDHWYRWLAVALVPRAASA